MKKVILLFLHIAVFALALSSTTASANLVVQSGGIPGMVDTATQLLIIWDWTPAGTEFSAPANPPTNWATPIDVVFDVPTNTWTISTLARHRTSPHPMDTVTPLVSFGLSFLDTAFGTFATTLTSLHPTILSPLIYHEDRWLLTVVHNSVGFISTITLSAVHLVPTPTTLLLFITGLIALIGMRSSRVRNMPHPA